MNIFNFTGGIGKDCRVNTTKNGSVCGFSVAVNSGYGDKEQTIWIDCTLWGKRAEGKLPEYLVKGQKVAVSGELGTREHEGKTYLTCNVNTIDLIGVRSSETGNGSDQGGARSQANKPANEPANEPAKNTNFDDFDDDIPF